MKLLLLFMLSAAAFTQNTLQSNIASTYNKLKESPFSLRMEEWLESTKDSDGDVNGIDNIHEFFLTYTPTKIDSFRLYHRFDTYYGQKDLAKRFTTDSTEFRYNRKLTSMNQSGFNSSTEARVLHLNSKNWYTNQWNVRYNIDTDITKNFNIGAIFRYEFYQHTRGYKRYGEKTKHMNAKLNRLRIYLTPAYVFNDKWFTFTSFRYSKNYRAGGVQDSDLTVIPELHYNVNTSLRVGAYADFQVLNTKDNRGWISDFINDSSMKFGVRGSLKLF